jgi:hypothetical protein
MGVNNITFGQAIVLWNMMNLNFLRFDYFNIYSRRMTNVDYIFAKITKFHWSRNFSVVNDLKSSMGKEPVRLDRGNENLIVQKNDLIN